MGCQFQRVVVVLLLLWVRGRFWPFGRGRRLVAVRLSAGEGEGRWAWLMRCLMLAVREGGVLQ